MMRTPIDIATRNTLEWLNSELELNQSRILEVGCGGGELAAALVEAGHDVLAIDSDSKCVDSTRARGVNAHHAAFPEFHPEQGESPFDVILFTRVMHHLSDLPAACARAIALLGEHGKIVLEDFAWERVDALSAAWIGGTMMTGQALDIVPHDEWTWGPDLLESWRQMHVDHELHTGASMLNAIGDVCTIEYKGEAPYVYRWFARYLCDDARGYDVTESMLRCEADLINNGSIKALGLRAIGSK